MPKLSVWAPVLTMLLVSFISYVDRNTLALLAPTILAEAGLTAQQYGFIISSFALAYTIGNPVWGRFLDQWGLRGGMALAVAFWTFASASHAFVGSFLGFAVARAALGFGEGATFPGGLRAAVQTLPPSKRSRGIAVAYSGGSLGAVATPLIITPIALWWGWRAAFIFTGLIGIAWLLLWTFVSRRPDVRRRPDSHQDEGSGAMRFRDPRIWSFGILYAAGALPIAFVIYGSAIYLNRALGVSQGTIGKLLWIPPLGWEAGYFFWGWIADRAAGRPGGRLPYLRKLFILLALLSALLAAAPSLRPLPLVMTELFLAMLVAAGFIILSISYATDVYSSRYAGLISGIGNASWSSAVAVFMPLFGRLYDVERYDIAFAVAGSLPAIGVAAWLALNRPQWRPERSAISNRRSASDEPL
ncbi:MAG: MFS transporter [Bryobacteraceae bacterium]|nr:MFS transporter [Bryobacteraceae bacterium]